MDVVCPLIAVESTRHSAYSKTNVRRTVSYPQLNQNHDYMIILNKRSPLYDQQQYNISCTGLNNVCEIIVTESPRNSEELRRFLGHANYMAKFMSTLSAESEPLHRLLNLPDKKGPRVVIPTRTPKDMLKTDHCKLSRMQKRHSRADEGDAT